MNHLRLIKNLACALTLTASSYLFPLIAYADSTWLITYSGALHNNGAEAEGLITFADAPPNPSFETLLLPGFEVTVFTLTVTNASSGNGVFDLSDFLYFSWNTNGVQLDLSQDLIGQITVNGLFWGSDDGAGGFGLGADIGSGAPLSLNWFELATSEGRGDLLALTSFEPASIGSGPVTVPLPGAVFLLFPALLAAVQGRIFRHPV